MIIHICITIILNAHKKFNKIFYSHDYIYIRTIVTFTKALAPTTMLLCHARLCRRCCVRRCHHHPSCYQHHRYCHPCLCLSLTCTTCYGPKSRAIPSTRSLARMSIVSLTHTRSHRKSRESRESRESR